MAIDRNIKVFIVYTSLTYHRAEYVVTFYHRWLLSLFSGPLCYLPNIYFNCIFTFIHDVNLPCFNL